MIVPKIIRVSISMILSLCIMLSLIAATSAVGELPQKNTAPRHQVCTALSEDAKAYYTGENSYKNLSALSGARDASDSLAAMQDNELFDALHTLMADTHTYFTAYTGYQKGTLAYFWASTDAIESSDTYVMFYSDVMAGEGTALNREHIWPKSRASYSVKGGGSDLHHLRPSVASVNSAKSDHLFGYINGTYSSGFTEGRLYDTVVYYVNKSKDLFECKDDVKGDVARILLYVYCRWGQPNLYSAVDSANLPPLDADDQLNKGLQVIESLDTLLQWCALDPVDSWEMERNDLAQRVQGNRNVFIDYPELAWQLFGRDLPVGMATPTHAGCTHHYHEISRTDTDGEIAGSFTMRCSVCGDEYTRITYVPTQIRQPLLGDADTDGSVTVVDATAIQRVLADLLVTAYDEKAADADCDRRVTILDATAIQRWLAGLPTAEGIGSEIDKSQ